MRVVRVLGLLTLICSGTAAQLPPMAPEWYQVTVDPLSAQPLTAASHEVEFLSPGDTLLFDELTITAGPSFVGPVVALAQQQKPPIPRADFTVPSGYLVFKFFIAGTSQTSGTPEQIDLSIGYHETEVTDESLVRLFRFDLDSGNWVDQQAILDTNANTLTIRFVRGGMYGIGIPVGTQQASNAGAPIALGVFLIVGLFFAAVRRYRATVVAALGLALASSIAERALNY